MQKKEAYMWSIYKFLILCAIIPAVEACVEMFMLHVRSPVDMCRMNVRGFSDFFIIRIWSLFDNYAMWRILQYSGRAHLVGSNESTDFF